MRTLLVTTAISIAMGVSNLAFAKATMMQTDSAYTVDLTFTSEAPVFLSSMTEDIYRGDFQKTSNAKLSTLTASDLYTGMGASKMVSVRSVT